MKKFNTLFTALLVVLFVVVAAISFMVTYEEEKNYKHSSKAVEISSNTVLIDNEKPTNIIVSSYSGEYVKNKQNVVLGKDGNYYIVSDGYVLTNKLHIDASNKEKIVVHDLN